LVRTTPIFKQPRVACWRQTEIYFKYGHDVWVFLFILMILAPDRECFSVKDGSFASTPWLKCTPHKSATFTDVNVGLSNFAKR